MKNLRNVAIAVVAVFAFTSCKKDYTCSCTFGGQTIDVSILDASKSDAEDACALSQTTYAIGDPTATCTLKEN